MSWLKNSPFRTNSFKQQARPVLRADFHCDPSACFDSFREHWQQTHKIIQRSQHLPSHDDVLGVVNHLEQMVTLLLYDTTIQNSVLNAATGNQPTGSCLEYLLSENILYKLYEWGNRTGRYTNAVRLEQLKLYEMLVSQSRHQLLVHEPFLGPLLKLLTACQDEIFPTGGELEKLLVSLLNQLCVLLMQNIDLLDLFLYTSNRDYGTCRFVIFSLLIPFIHREGALGMQARDALLLCMSFSNKNKNIGVYIATHSNICILLASGLNGLYSNLPHTLRDVEAEDWHRFTPDDVNDIKGLATFMNSLEFCNAVAQVAHPVIKQQLHEFLYSGFLIPVIGPSLLQNSIDEQVAATAYLDLLLRSATEPGLLLSLVKFLMEIIYDGKRILDILITRIKGNSRLSLVSLALFETLIELNCEDLMLELVFEHLQPCMHLMLTQRKLLHDFDPYCQNVDKFLLLIPSCCSYEQNGEGTFRASPVSSLDYTRLMDSVSWNYYGAQFRDSLYGNYHAYLCDARTKITACKIACSNWTNKYDGCDTHKSSKLEDIDVLFSNFKEETSETVKMVKEDYAHVRNADENTTSSSLNSLSESSGYESFKSKFDNVSDTYRSSPISAPVWQVSLSDKLPVDCTLEHNAETTHKTSCVGLFLNTLFDLLENMLNNNVYVNLHLTGLFSRLAVYSQPLLRTYLLNQKLVLQPNIRSLFQVIGTLKQKLDEYMCNNIDAESEIKQARWFLIERETRLLNARKRATETDMCNSHNTSSETNNSGDFFKRDESKRRSLSSSFSSIFRRPSQVETSNLILLNREDDNANSSLSKWYKEKSEIKSYALCSIILEEWLKELAAISQEHTILQLTTVFN